MTRSGSKLNNYDYIEIQDRKSHLTKVFLDANIILDFFNENRKGHNTSKNILSLLTEKGISIAVTEDLIPTIYYVTKDKQAIKICLNKQNDFEDVLQSLSAKDIGCTHIVSNDLKFYDCGIKICTGDEFLEIANHYLIPRILA